MNLAFIIIIFYNLPLSSPISVDDDDEFIFEAEPPLIFAACYNNLTEATRLIDVEGANVNERDWLFQTPLHLAAKFNRLDIVRLLISRGARINAKNKDYEETALHLAAKGNHLDMINFLLDRGADIESAISRRIGPGGTPLLYASSYANSVDAVNLLISRGANINATNSYPQTALHHAIEHQNIYLAHVLMNKHHINKEVKDEWGNSALNWIVKLYTPPQAVLVRLLLQAGANTESRDNNGRTPLHNAALYGHLEIVALLIAKGAIIDQRDIYGKTPLYSTVIHGIGRIGKITRLLLKHGANPNAADRDGCDAPLFALARNRRRDSGEVVGLARILVTYGVDVNKVDPCTQMTAIGVAAKTLQWPLLEFLKINATVPLPLFDPIGDDILDSRKIAPDIMTAAAVGDVFGVMLALVRDGILIDSRDYRNQTALHFAAWNGHVNVALVLLRNGADVLAVDCDNMTPLHKAAAAGHVEMMELLLQNGANPNAVAKNGAAPIHYAIDFRNSSDIIEALFDYGANISQYLMPEMMTPLHLAVVTQNFHFIEMLIREGADVNARNINGATPLNHLLMSNCCYPQLPAIGFLLDRGADIEARNDRGWTPLHMAILSKKRYEVIEYLLYRGAQPNALDVNNCNAPLFLLVSSAISTANNNNMSGGGHELRTAVDDIVELLVSYGADYNQVDECLGIRALDVALDTNQVEVVELLQAYQRRSQQKTPIKNVPNNSILHYNTSYIPLY